MHCTYFPHAAIFFWIRILRRRPQCAICQSFATQNKEEKTSWGQHTCAQRPKRDPLNALLGERTENQGVKWPKGGAFGSPVGL